MSAPAPAAHRFTVPSSSGNAREVSALLCRPDAARALMVLAHGAGADMHHRFMDALATGLANAGIATLRYQFPYTEQGSKRPDPRGRLLATVRAAVDCAAKLAPDLPLVAGGKSMGGRMTSQAEAEAPLPGVRGLVFFGFPLHAAGKPQTERADHLASVERPLLFLQGTRDALADLELLSPIIGRLGPAATLHVVDGADHSFHVLKRSGRSDPEVLDELVSRTAAWVDELA